MNIAVVARISYEKNPFYIIDIFIEVLKRNPNANLIWMGDGQLKKDIQDYIQKAGIDEHVRLLGSVQNVNEILPCCDCFLLPSIREAFGISAIEAQAASCFAFVADCCPKEIDCGGVEFISIKEAPSFWAQKICDRYDRKEEVHIKQDMIEKFDIRNTVKDLLDFYERIV